MSHGLRNHFINYVTAPSRLLLLYSRVQSARHWWFDKPANPVCSVPPGLRHAPFSVRLPGNGKKTPAQDPIGMDGERIREDVTVLRGSLPDKPRPDAFASTSKRQVSPPPPSPLIELP